MSIKHLKWDSDFFGFKVGEIEGDFNINLDLSSFELLFLKSIEENISDINPKLSGFQISYHEKKVFFEKGLMVSQVKLLSAGLKFSLVSDLTEELKELALSSGVYSRFKKDPKFPNRLFEKMYEKWISDSVSSSSIKVLGVYNTANNLVGFASIDFGNEQFAQIGLIAVKLSMNGKGIGKKLLTLCELIAFNEGRTLMRISTQACNIAAVKFYESMGYTTHRHTHLYHLWKSH